MQKEDKQSMQNRGIQSRHFGFSDRGSIESGLTIIPTTAFFLLILQLVISGSFQVVDAMNLQNYVTRQALGQQEQIDFYKSREVAGKEKNLAYKEARFNLPGGGSFIVATSATETPQLSTLIGFKPKVKAQAIAIEE